MLFSFVFISLIGFNGDWYRSLDDHWNFCVGVNFENPMCPQITSVYEVYSEPEGELTSKSLMLAATALRLQRPALSWLQAQGLDGEKPKNIDPLLWDNARWIYAQTLYDQKKYKEASHIFDTLVDTFKSRAIFHQQRAWAQFFAGQYDRALGSIVSAESPLIDKVPFPKKHLLRALIERENCQYEKAFRTITEGRLELERAFLTGEESVWVKLCDKKKAHSFCGRLKSWFQKTYEDERKSTQIDLDYLETEMNQKGLKDHAEVAKVKKAPVVWPFVGEAWADELGYYTVEVRSACIN